MKTLKLLALLSFAVAPAWAQDEAHDEAGVTPYRPSVSSPAQLPLPGQLEFELGALSTRTGEARRDSLPYTFKLAFDEQWGVLAGGEGYVSARDESGQRARGTGDLSLVLKRAFLLDSATAFGLELGVKVPVARDSIGSGKTDYSLNGIFSKDIAALHMDANLNLTREGAVEPGSGRTQSGWSAAFSTPLSEKWGATAELSGTRRRGQDSTAQLLLAATYNPSKRLAIDVGFARGLTPASPDWSWFSGLVLPLARLW